MRLGPGCALLVAGLLASISPVPAEAIDVAVDLSAQSAYVWRGMVLNDRPVFQPSITLVTSGFSASMWGNSNLTADRGRRGELNEIDYWAAYTAAGKAVDVTATYYSYTFPRGGGASTQEVWANATFKKLPMSPSVTAIRDVKTVKGWYFLLSGSQAVGVLKTSRSDGLLLTLNVGHGTMEYSRGYFPELEHEGVTDYGVRLDWAARMGPGKLKLNLQYADFTDSDVESPGFEDARAGVFGGVTYSFSF
jgi:uncharacterized protein (TIGR02001 family)